MDYKKRQEDQMKVHGIQSSSRNQFHKAYSYQPFRNNIKKTAPSPYVQNSWNIEAQSAREKAAFKNLMKQNSELRKKIYQLQHDLSLAVIAAQEKEFEYKNILGQYRKIIEEMLIDVGYSSIDELCPQNVDNCNSQRRLNSIDSLRSKPGAKQKELLNAQKQMRLDSSVSAILKNKKAKGTNILAFEPIKRNKQVNVSILEGSSIKSEICLPRQFYIQMQVQTQFQSQNLNYSQRAENKTVTSITDPISPNFDNYESILQIEQNPTINLKKDEKQSINQASTKRKIESTENKRRKKGSGKSYSETESLKMIIEQRNKNRERIEQLLKNFQSTNDYC